jgi:hypothetical protein
MKNSLLSSVAALALIVGIGPVFAQGTGMKEAPAAVAPKADSASPSPKAESASPSPKAESAAPANLPKGSSAETAPPAGAKTGATAQDKGGEPKGSKAASDTKPSSAATTPSTNSASKDAKNPAADSKAAGTDTKAGSNTTGNAATSATAAPPAEKRTQIVSAIKQEKVEEVTNVNFNISIGTAVPSSVRYHPLPPRIVEIYPEWRGYDFIVVRGKYIILRPQTHEIVYIIEG